MNRRTGNRKLLKGEKLHEFFEQIREQGHKMETLTFVCIGTDCSTGDSLGPLTGSMLTQAGFPHVIGTLESPCDSSSMLVRLREIPSEHTVIAVDCSVGPSVGMFQTSFGPVEPGKSMGKPLPAIGDYSVLGIVSANTANPYKVLQTVSLYRVMTMARQIAEAARSAFSLPQDPTIGNSGDAVAFGARLASRGGEKI